MSRRLPADGGPYAYARAAFGNGVGFANAWSYWITAWAGNAAIVVGWVFYVEHFVNKDGSTSGWSIVIALVGLWIPAADQPHRRQEHGRRPGVDHGPEVRPAGLHVDGRACSSSRPRNFTPWNTSGDTNLSAIGGAMAICLFSYLGVETAAVAAAQGPRPRPQRPEGHDLRHAGQRGRLPAVADRGLRHRARRGAGQDANQAPYSAAANSMVGGTLGRLRVAARRRHLRLRRAQRLDDDLRRDAAGRGQGRPVPRAVRHAVQSRGVPAFGIIASTALASVAMVISYLGASGATVFTTLVS